eukprot:TRINITY_DN9570_c0_g1_i1.p1 TRINITY_DN9570_c0_g1~~TRINITY_DN9570_c0_g1_i1.p1  ORF type:complete len:527 (+),score=160.94 TRINITY_DN9570_c0_g1_i1:56-1636(+)
MEEGGLYKLFISGVPMQYASEDVTDLFSRHGEVAEVYLLPPKNNNPTRSAFVKYRTREEAESAIESLNDIEFTGQNERLQVKYSKPSGKGAGGSGGTSERRSENRPRDYPVTRDGGRFPERTGRAAGGGMSSGPLERRQRNTGHGKMLFFTVRNDRQEKVNCKVLDKVLTTCGQPVKILIVPNGRDGCQGWALMENPRMAQRAIETLDGRNIFNDDCLLHLELSDKQDLDIKYNNNLSWDYVANLPQSGSILGEDDLSGRPGKSMGSMSGGSSMGGMGSMGGMRDRERDYDGRGRRGAAKGPVVLVCGLHQDINPETNQPYFTTHTLQTIMGVFGDVMRMKLLLPKEDKKDTQALVMFRRPEEAELARDRLNHCPIYGTSLAIFLSDKEEIRVPNDPDETFADFGDLRMGRFGPKFPVERLRGARPPSNVLYVSGLDPAMSSEDLKDAYLPDGAIDAEMFRAKKSEGKVEFETIEAAYAALVRTHNETRLGTFEFEQPVRVAFSDRSIGQSTLKRVGDDRPGRKYD